MSDFQAGPHNKFHLANSAKRARLANLNINQAREVLLLLIRELKLRSWIFSRPLNAGAGGPRSTGRMAGGGGLPASREIVGAELAAEDKIKFAVLVRHKRQTRLSLGAR
jgi:hypothetical protein